MRPEEIGVSQELYPQHAIGQFHLLVSPSEGGEEATLVSEAGAFQRDVVRTQLVLARKLVRLLRELDPLPHQLSYHHAARAMAEAARDQAADEYVFRDVNT